MNPLVVLVTLDPDDSDARPLVERVAADPELRDRVELRFARGEDILAHVGDAEIACCGNLSAQAIDAASNLRWISFWSAGLDGKITPQLRAKNLLLTNASGVHGANIAEHVMAWMLMFTRQMPFHLRSQIRGEWLRGSGMVQAQELTGQTLGIVGLGRIGEALAVRAQAFGMRVVAMKRDVTARYDASIPIDMLYSPSELPELLGVSDHVCIALPHTPETTHLFNAELLAKMKPSAYLYNIARGKIVDETALIQALQSGTIAGAGLDVFEEEPLSSESPLWQLENVLITPHTAGATPHYFVRFADLFCANLKRYLRNEPLTNLYTSDRGY